MSTKKVSGLPGKVADAIEEYQCSGCVNGPALTCYLKRSDSDGVGCARHCPGTISSLIGPVLLGMPKGFNRLGKDNAASGLRIYTTFAPEFYNEYRIAVWKYRNDQGHTFVRVMLPRKNLTLLLVYLVDCLDQIACMEVTEKMIEYMD